MTQSISRSTRPRSSDSTALRPALPQVERLLDGRRADPAAVDEVAGLGEVLPLDLQRAGLAAVGQPDLAAAGDVVGDLADRADRVLHREVAHHHALLDHPQHQVAAGDLEHRGGLAHVGVADDDVQAAVLLGVRVRLVAGVDDRPATGWWRWRRPPRCARRAGETLYDAPRGVWVILPAPTTIWRVTRNGISTSASRLNSPARPDEVVLVAAVGVAGGVGVVLEQVDLAGDALVVQPLLGVEEQPLEDPLPRLVVGDQLDDVVALGGGVLRVAADVEVEPGAVAQEDVAAAAPADDLAEQVARHLVGAQPALALERARDAVLVLDPEDPPVHAATLRPSTSCGRNTADRAVEISGRPQPCWSSGSLLGGGGATGGAAGATGSSSGGTSPLVLVGRVRRVVRAARRWRRCRAGAPRRAGRPPRPGCDAVGPRSPSSASSRDGPDPAELPRLRAGAVEDRDLEVLDRDHPVVGLAALVGRAAQRGHRERERLGRAARPRGSARAR